MNEDSARDRHSHNHRHQTTRKSSYFARSRNHYDISEVKWVDIINRAIDRITYKYRFSQWSRTVYNLILMNIHYSDFENNLDVVSIFEISYRWDCRQMRWRDRVQKDVKWSVDNGFVIVREEDYFLCYFFELRKIDFDRDQQSFDSVFNLLYESWDFLIDYYHIWICINLKADIAIHKSQSSQLFHLSHIMTFLIRRITLRKCFWYFQYDRIEFECDSEFWQLLLLALEVSVID